MKQLFATFPWLWLNCNIFQLECCRETILSGPFFTAVTLAQKQSGRSGAFSEAKQGLQRVSFGHQMHSEMKTKYWSHLVEEKILREGQFALPFVSTGNFLSVRVPWESSVSQKWGVTVKGIHFQSNIFACLLWGKATLFHIMPQLKKKERHLQVLLSSFILKKIEFRTQIPPISQPRSLFVSDQSVSLPVHFTWNSAAKTSLKSSAM